MSDVQCVVSTSNINDVLCQETTARSQSFGVNQHSCELSMKRYSDNSVPSPAEK